MAAQPQKDKVEDGSVLITKIRPSQIASITRALWYLEESIYLWGPPGIGKSELLEQQATAAGVAYIDIRLATKNPSQIAGVPYPVEDHGQTLAKWQVPEIFPRDIKIDNIIDIRAAPRNIDFSTFNPTGKNGIHYVTKPDITVTSLEPELTARIISQTPDSFVVVLEDETGRAMAGAVRYQITGEARALMCLDELSSANPAVQAAAYSLTLDRRMDTYVVPIGVKICAAGNREFDKGVNYTMVMPLRNRFTHYELEVSWADWDSYARGVSLYPFVVDFHRETEGKYLFVFDPESASMNFASPRSWTKLCKWEAIFDDLKMFDEHIRMATYAGLVGDQIARIYATHKTSKQHLPKAVDILSGNITTVEEKLSVADQKYISNNVIWIMRKRMNEIRALKLNASDPQYENLMALWYEESDRAILFFKAHFKAEIVASIVRTSFRKYRLPFAPNKMPHFKQYMEDNPLNLT